MNRRCPIERRHLIHLNLFSRLGTCFKSFYSPPVSGAFCPLGKIVVSVWALFWKLCSYRGSVMMYCRILTFSTDIDPSLRESDTTQTLYCLHTTKIIAYVPFYFPFVHVSVLGLPAGCTGLQPTSSRPNRVGWSLTPAGDIRHVGPASPTDQ